jgi:predicted phage tail protein
MQLIKVIPCGSLADKYPVMEIGAATAAEAIEGWSKQICPNGMIPELIEVLDFESEHQLKNRTEVTEIKLYPAMYGAGGMAKFMGIIIGAAMIAAALLIPGLNAVVVTSLIVSGATAMAMGVINLFLPAPSLSKEEDPEASKYVGSGRNTTKIGTPIPIAGGRMLAGGHFMSVQVNATELVYGRMPDTPPA